MTKEMINVAFTLMFVGIVLYCLTGCSTATDDRDMYYATGFQAGLLAAAKKCEAANVR